MYSNPAGPGTYSSPAGPGTYSSPGTPSDPYASPGAPYQGAADNAANPYGGGAAYSQYGSPASGYGPPASPYGSPASQYGGGYGQFPNRPISGAAVASLILGILGAFVVTAIASVICGIVALSNAKSTGQRGKGLAIAGIILSVIWVFIFVILAVIGAKAQSTSSNPPSGGSGGNTNNPSLSVLNLSVGDCFNYPSDESNISTVSAIPCSQAHDAQIYAQFKLSGTAYPSNITSKASSGCQSRTGSLNTSLVTKSMTLHFLYPKPFSWVTGNKTVNCVVVSPTPVNSSMVTS